MKDERKTAPVIRFNGFSDAWEQRKLGDESDVRDGTHDSPQYFDTGYPLVTSKNLKNHGLDLKDVSLIAEADYNAINQRSKVDEGDILFGMIGTIGNPVLVRQTNFAIKNVALIKEHKRILNQFLIQLLKSPVFERYIKSENAGGTQKFLALSKIRSFEFKVPNLEEQQKIGSFFKQLDNTIALHQRKLDTLKLMKKGFLQQMFPEKGEKVPKLRFADFEEEWEQRKLGEYGEFYYGKSAPKWSVTEDAVIPCVRYGELYTKFGAKIDRIYSYTNIPKENLKFSTGYEVLVPRVGENPLEFAKCSWLKIPNVAIGEMISVYNTKQNPLFIAIYFRAKMRIEFAKRVEGGNVSNLYYSYLENILLSIPSIGEQVRIAKIFSKLDDIINLQQNKIDKFKNLKKSYLQNMFI
ncbi:restriction endonuclease subunit S [Listeria ivanovii]|uniref:restriction endonuclease subunit S n=1 Tax=Listeria ivanovii TaxID=1638 RepID=UPI003CE886E8